MADKIILSIKRYDPDRGKTWIQDYELDQKPGLTVLEALYFIAENLDGSLSFRYSCRGSVCGSCAMMINNTITLACHTQISDLLPGKIKIEPLPKFKILKDLVVEMDDFLQKYRSVEPYMLNDFKDNVENLQTPENRKVIIDSVKCILCASCHAACPLTAFDEDYLGPAALNAVHRFGFDERNKDADRIIMQVNNQQGTFGCKTISRCTDVCPKEIAPSQRIREIKAKIKDLSVKRN
jgi:succinate dehydrogenase / fumarate reductase iron-sulfur subunit